MKPHLLRAVVVGGGPAGLMAAEVLAAGGAQVDLYDAMPSVGRKFLLAGIGGLNLTHSEPLPSFLGRYGARRVALEAMLAAFGPAALRSWAQGLGISTFVGSSGRVFPTDMKAAPLLRAWLHRLRGAGVSFHMRHRWLGWDPNSGRLRLHGPQGECLVEADAVVLALGGASWPRLGSDGAWWPLLAERGVDLAPLLPSNCGFDVTRPEAPGWSDFFRTRFGGQPVKNVAMTLSGVAQAGEFLVTEGGVEGSLVYAFAGPARAAIEAHGQATLHIDLLPNRAHAFVRDEVARPRGSRSMSTHLKSRLGIDGIKAALLHELLPRETFGDPGLLADSIKHLPLTLAAPRPIAEAISSAGGVRFEAMDATLRLNALPEVACAGEMLDWEAPTGGYLLTACFATGAVAARGVLQRGKGAVLQAARHPAP
jgi:uncharacterized flavoprotein (TIGR03862 family)